MLWLTPVLHGLLLGAVCRAKTVSRVPTASAATPLLPVTSYEVLQCAGAEQHHDAAEHLLTLLCAVP